MLSENLALAHAVRDAKLGDCKVHAEYQVHILPE